MALRAELHTLSGKVHEFLNVVELIEELMSLREGLKDPVVNEQCQEATKALIGRLNAIAADADAAAIKSLQTDVELACSEWRTKVHSVTRGGRTLGITRARLRMDAEGPPNIGDGEVTDTEGRMAARRMASFQWLCWALAVLFLAGTGFQELYLKNPVFGQNPWLDYFGVFLWGFGAEATRASVTSTIRNWDLPTV